MNPAMLVYRIGNRLHRAGFRRTAWLISWGNRFLFSAWIPSSAQIGRHVTLGYWGLGIVIHQDAVIGEGCRIGQNVTIGRNPGREGVPVIGKNVYIAAGRCYLRQNPNRRWGGHRRKQCRIDRYRAELSRGWRSSIAKTLAL